MPIENQEISIILRVYAIELQTELPENLTLILLSESGESLAEIQAGWDKNYLEQSLTGKSGERFRVKLVLKEINVIEDFVI